ncbi:MAG: ParA family protein [Pseudomonadota bacterium]|nr:ParA family protein [Pseudomonadota bacterium]
MRVLSIMNHKGGVGKTTLSKLISEWAVRQDLRVLGVDMDPQANFSTRFIDMIEEDGRPSSPPVHPDFDPDDREWQDLHTPPPGYWSIAQLFRLGYVEPYATRFEKMMFVPSHRTELTDLLLEVRKADIEDALVRVLQDVLDDEFYAENFDLAVIDTPPQVSPITAAAARAATHVLIPTMMHEDSLRGMISMAELWRSENLSRANRELKLVGVLPTLYDKRASDQRANLEELQGHAMLSPYLLEQPMSHMTTYRSSSTTYAEPKSLFDLSEKNRCRQEAESICDEILRRTMA